MDVAARCDRLRGRLAAAGCDGLLVTRLVNIRYLTGFTGSAGLLLVLPSDLVLVTDGRYGEQAEAELGASGAGATLHAVPAGDAQRRVLAGAAAGAGRLGLEAEDVTWAAQRRFATDWFPGAELVPTTGVVEDLRRVKDAGEIARMAAAAAVADGALARVRPGLSGGPSEREVALELEWAIRRAGAAVAFDTIVAGGPNAARPHHRPTDRPIGPGELVVIDFGAAVDGYRSDMTRTVCVDEPAGEGRRMVEVVARAQAAGVAAVRAGAPAAAVDGACRRVVEEAGWGPAFVHPSGHGIGLEVHEAPRVAAASASDLMAGDVVTVEPGVYLPGVGGARIEDTVAVEQEGCRMLTRSPKELVIAR